MPTRQRRLAGHPAVRPRASSQLTAPGDPTWSWLTGDPYPDVLWANEASAMGLPPFGRGVALLANAVAGTEWRALRWDSSVGIDVRLADQPRILTDPDPTTTIWNYRWAAVEDLVLYGNHFAICGTTDDATLRPSFLAPVSATDVWLLVDPETGGAVFTIGGELLEPVNLDDPLVDPGRDAQAPVPSQYGRVFQVSAGNRSGELLGRGVLTQYGTWLGGAVAAEVHAGAYFAGGALPPAVLQSPTTVTQAQAEDLKSAWREMTSSREPVVLPMGYVLTPVVSNAEQAQLVESRQWNAEAVAMMLGIPSYKLGLPGPSMTYQNIESADIEFVRDSVDRYGQPLVEAFSKWLLPRGTTAAWDYAGRMRADQSTTSQVLTTYTGAGVLTVDEARSVIGRPPLAVAPDKPQTPADVPELTPQEVP